MEGIKRTYFFFPTSSIELAMPKGQEEASRTLSGGQCVKKSLPWAGHERNLREIK